MVLFEVNGMHCELSDTWHAVDGKALVRGSYLAIQDYLMQFQEGRIYDYVSFVFSFIVPSTVWGI